MKKPLKGGIIAALVVQFFLIVLVAANNRQLSNKIDSLEVKLEEANTNRSQEHTEIDSRLDDIKSNIRLLEVGQPN